MTIPELLVTMLVFGVLSTVVLAFMTAGLRTIDSTSQRMADSKDAQIVSAYLETDVQSQTQVIGTECGMAAGETRLVGFRKADATSVVYYSSITAATIVRRACGIGGTVASTNTLARNLAATPTVRCDNAACAVGTAPDKVVLAVTTTGGYSFELAGARRTFTDPVVAAPVTTMEPDYPVWGRTLTVLGLAADEVKLDSQAVVKVNGDVAVSSTSASWCKACTSTSFIINDADGVLQQPLADPLGSLAYPDVSTMTVFTGPAASGAHYQGPGVYRFPVSIKESHTVASGVYVFEQGLAISGSSTGVTSELSGSGVLLFNGCARNSPATCANSGKITFNGGARVNLTAPTSGTYAGIVIMQARENDGAATLRAGGSGLNHLDGLVYLASPKITTINVEPGATMAIGSLIVTKLDAGSGSYTIGTLS